MRGVDRSLKRRDNFLNVLITSEVLLEIIDDVLCGRNESLLRISTTLDAVNISFKALLGLLKGRLLLLSAGAGNLARNLIIDLREVLRDVADVRENLVKTRIVNHNVTLDIDVGCRKVSGELKDRVIGHALK